MPDAKTDAVEAYRTLLIQEDSRAASAFLLTMSDAELRDATDAALALVRLATRRRRCSDGSYTFGRPS